MLPGVKVAEKVFERVDPELRWHAHAEEGEWSEGGLVAELAGSAAVDPGRRAGGAELPRPAVGHRDPDRRATSRRSREPGATILDTRKTTPGMRALEKEAVRAGGGVSHRNGLYDAILVKENHSALAGGVAVAARLALEAARGGVAVEVECATLADVVGALDAGVPRLLLDNMAPDELRQAVELAGGRAELEASGGVTLETIRAVAETGVDYISVGALTHSAPALDFSLLLEPLE